MYQSGYDIGCFWDNGDGGDTSNSSSSWGSGEHSRSTSTPRFACGFWGDSERLVVMIVLLDTAAGYRMNPMHLGLEMLATAQNRSLLKVEAAAAGSR